MTNTNEDRVREYAAQIVEWAPDMTKPDADQLSADLLQLLSDKQALAARLEIAKARRDTAEASLTAAQERAGELEKALTRIAGMPGYPTVEPEHVEGLRKRYTHAQGIAEEALTPTPRIQQGPGIGGGVS